MSWQLPPSSSGAHPPTAGPTFLPVREIFPACARQHLTLRSCSFLYGLGVLFGVLACWVWP